MNYKNKYYKYKTKYAYIKNLLGGSLGKEIIIEHLSDEICSKVCNVSLKEFVELSKKDYNELLIDQDQTEKSKLISSLVDGTSLQFYKDLQNKIKYSITDVKLINEKVDKLKEDDINVIFLGTSEALADLAINIYNKAKNSTDGTYEAISNYILNHQSLSSMDYNFWTPQKNQSFIADTLIDPPEEEGEERKNVWNITNTALAIILPSNTIEDNGQEIKLNFKNAIDEIGCRVTKFEICLIYKIITSEEIGYKIDYINLDNDKVMIFFINNSFGSKTKSDSQ